jgi:hypothetical protein
MRVVPIHSELIKLGLIDYHAAIRARGEKQLFPGSNPIAVASFPVTRRRSLMTTFAILE